MDLDQVIKNEPDGSEKSSDTTDSRVGQIVGGHYEILFKLGSGGMGTVYKAKHLLLNRFAAVKLLSKLDDKAVQRFQQEAKAAGHLQHANIAGVHEFGFDANDNPYLVMDFVEGVPLSEIIQKQGRLPAARLIDIALKICDGLAYAHNNGVIHRDIKPANIMLSQSENGTEQVKIIDFGIAKLLLEGQDLTQTGETFGSPLYMSPEQCRGEKLNAQSDIYSFGCLLFQALTGHCPFEGENALKTLVMHINDCPPSLNSVDKSLVVPRGLESVVQRMLAKERSPRYQRVEDLQSDLELVKAGVKLKPVYGLAFLKKLWKTGLICFVIVWLGLCINAALHVKKSKWEILSESGINERNAGNYLRANYYFDQALTEARQFKASPDKIAKLLRMAGETNLELAKKQTHDQKYEKQAMQQFDLALHEVEAESMRSSPDADQKAFVLYDYGKLFFNQKNYARAADSFQAALDAKHKGGAADVLDFPELHDTILLGLALAYDKQYPKSESVLREVISTYEQNPSIKREGKLSRQFPSYVFAVSSLADVYRLDAKFKEADATYSKAINLSDGVYPEDSQFIQNLTRSHAELQKKLKGAK